MNGKPRVTFPADHSGGRRDPAQEWPCGATTASSGGCLDAYLRVHWRVGSAAEVASADHERGWFGATTQVCDNRPSLEAGAIAPRQASQLRSQRPTVAGEPAGGPASAYHATASGRVPRMKRGAAKVQL